MLISTGVPQLDKMIAGGLKTNFCYAIKGTAGIGKTVLSLFITKGALNQGIPVIYITTEVAPEEILDYAKSFSLDFDDYI
ncbi:MAG: RAD55 family ATPase, partial [Candidatus Heimdallarchaeaceae archaeon]